MKKAIASMMVVMMSGCATMTTDQGGNAVKIAEAKYRQDLTFVAFELSGVSEIKGTNIHIVARSYRPPISIVPEPSIMDKLFDAAKWVAGFYFGSEMLKSVSAQHAPVQAQVVEPTIVQVPEGSGIQ